MSSTTPARPGPREVPIRVRRLAIAGGLAVLPLILAACGLFGGGNDQGNAPVVIPSGTPSSETASGDSPSSPTVSTAAAAPPPSTVTRTGLVTRYQTRVVRTTSTKTLPRATVTQPPITLTETRTETQTNTQTIISVPPPRTVTRTIIRTRAIGR